jgi:hypothetical protein
VGGIKSQSSKNAHLALLAGRADRRFQFHKRSQLFIGVRHETLTVTALSIHDPHHSPFAIPQLKYGPNSTFPNK